MTSVVHWSSASLLSLPLVFDCSPESNHVNDSYLSFWVTPPGRGTQEPPLRYDSPRHQLRYKRGYPSVVPGLCVDCAFIHDSVARAQCKCSAATYIMCIHAGKVCSTPSHFLVSDFLSWLFLYTYTFLCQKTALSLVSWPTLNVTWLQAQQTIVLLNELWPVSQSLSLSLAPSLIGAFQPGLLAVSPYAQVGWSAIKTSFSKGLPLW